MQKKEKRARRKINKVNLAAIIVSIIALLGVFFMLVGLGSIAFLLKDKPKLNLDDFESAQSTIVLDKDDNQISELGKVIRQNVEYEDLPQSLIDAFVAVEDSRFFEHNGFDLSRFTKAIFANLKTLSFSQGASTFTMQLVKNTYFTNDDKGEGASRNGLSGIKRKVQEIALSMELEKKASKKEIFVNYLNKLYFGGTEQNIRGVQKAAQYYFGKNVQDLNLCESAMLAGVINAPNSYNPYLSSYYGNTKYLDYAQDRRDETLYLMNRHGYISDEEYKIAKATRVEDFLKDTTYSRGSNEGIAYQAYVDAVIDEVYDLTGLDPYTTPMIIHTSMDKNVQELMDNIQAGNVDDYFEYPDDEFEVASLCINNKTGEIIGILGGRNYADGGSLLLNHATSQKKQPGSSIKPILDYVQAFEVLGWSTSHSVVDQPLVYEGTDFVITNSTNKYAGQVTLKYAVGMSLNTPAITTIRQLINAKGYTYLTDYMINMGFDIDIQDFDEQYGIGGKGLEVTCKQLAGAYATLMNKGYYTTPHTVKKIEFLSDKPAVTPTYQSKQNVSEQACYLMTEILKNNVEGGYPNLMGLFKNDEYTVYAKTGTTNYDASAEVYGIPAGTMRDGWVVGCTSDYSVATWMGYEKAQKGKPSYMPAALYNQNIKGKITKLILQETVDKYGTPEDVQKPSGISTITHIIGTFPYTAPTIEGLSEEYITTGKIKSDSKYNYLASPQQATVENLKSDPEFTLNGTELKIEWPKYPDEDKLKVADETMDISLKRSDGSTFLPAEGARLFDYTWVYGAIKYKANINVDGKSIDVVSSDNAKTVDLREYVTSGSKIKACAFYGYETGASSDSKCKEIEVTDEKQITVNPISANITVEEIEKMFPNYKVNVTEKTSSDIEKNSTVNKIEFKDSTGSQTIYSSGSTKEKTTYTVHELSLTVEVELLVKTPKIKSLTLAEGYTQTVTVDDTVILNYDANVSSISASLNKDGNISVDTTNKKITVKFLEESDTCTLEVIATLNDKTDKQTMSFTVNPKSQD